VLRIAAGEHIEPHVGRFIAGVTMTRYYDTVILPDGLKTGARPRSERATNL
jgi:hypothetical protein